MPAAKSKTQSEIKLLDAQSAAFEAQRRRDAAETRTATAVAKLTELALERDVQEREDELAANAHHKVYIFDSEVSDSAVKKCINQLTTWSRQEPDCEIEIQVNSPGGVIFAGFALIDFIRDLRSKGHKI